LFTRWLRPRTGVEKHPLYGLGLQVQKGRLSLEQATARIEATRDLRDLADSQLVELDAGIADLIPTNRGFAFILASLNYAVARAKGFRRVQVDCSLRLVDLTYETQGKIVLLREAVNASRKSGYRRGEKVALATLASLFAQEGRYEEAIGLYKDQIESAKAGGYAAIDAESLLALGDIYRVRGEVDEALETFERAVRVAGAAGQPTEQVEALTRAAELSLLKGDPAAALDALQRGLLIAEASKNRQLESALAGLLGDLLRDLQRADDALTAYRRALTLNGEDVQGQISILARLVPLCADAGHWQDTADYARQGLIVSDGQFPAQEVLWLLDLAMALLELGRDLEAIDAARDALVIARMTEPSGRLEHDTLGRLGTLLTETGRPDEAVAVLEAALELSTMLGDGSAGATWLTHLARCAWYAGDMTGAIDRYTEALSATRQLGDRPLEAHILGSLGTLLRETGQQRRSLEYYHQALELSKVANEGREVVRYLTQMGRTYGELRQYDDARRSFNEALTLARRIDDKRGQVEIHRRLATLLRSRRDREGAMAQITAAAGLIAGIDDPRLASITLQELASVQEELGRWEESAASYRRMLSNAERIDDLNGKLQAHLQLGRILQYQQPNEAQRHLRQALDLAHEINDPQIIDRVSELLPTGTESATVD
jgi:tetratricopeptide (TPR) repeat protein